MKSFTLLITTGFLLLGCTQGPSVQTPAPKKEVEKPKTYAAPPAPKKNIKLKAVEDDNFSSDYMYPETNKKSVKKVEELPAVADATTTSAMSNEECIAMIGQEKYDKYAEMFGAAGALKKCKMLKAL